MPTRRLIATAVLSSMLLAAAPSASAEVPVSELVLDARTGRSLYAADADRARPAASLTKMMTLLLAFDALRAGRLRLDERLVMTAEGVRQAPSRLGLARGASISVRDALRAIAVISANDVAVALADRLAGSEAAFTREMDRRARSIGMVDTHFANATGLPTGRGWSTARDLAALSRYLLDDYPDRYKLFGTRSISWGGRVRPNHNQLLGRVPGVDGIKTGYTAAAGYNLAASSVRGGARVIVVVLGERSARARDTRVANLLELGFTPHAPAPAIPSRGHHRGRRRVA